MKLADFLAPARVLVPLGCETLDSACSALLARLAASGTISDVERLQSRIAEERGEDMVAIADRAFLLHGLGAASRAGCFARRRSPVARRRR